MRLTVIGCSPAWPNPGGAHAGFLVEGEGRLLLDCGPGVLARLRGQGGWPRVDAIALTHLHLDHCGDLVAWMWGLLHGPGGGVAAPKLFVPPGARRRLADELAGPQIEEVFEIAEYADRESFTAAGFTLTPREVLHYGERAYGLTVEGNSKRLAYSGDTGPCEALVELARDADLFLCEATLDDGAVDGEPRGHLKLGEALAAFRAARARRLLIVHRGVELSTDGSEPAHEGLVVEL